jgi:hypothetical protein
MGTAYVDKLSALGALLLLSLSIGGCATSTAGSSAMDARDEAPPKASVYLPVEDLPPKREKPAMKAEERSKVTKELTAVHDRQTSRVKAREDDAPGKPKP